MARKRAPSSAAAARMPELPAAVPPGPFQAELAAWLAEDRRFRDFAERHHAKIRKKLRSAWDAESLGDVRAELLAARRLLAVRRFDVAFEAYGSGRVGPDFTVSSAGQRPFNVEVTRLRRPPDGEAAASVILAKLRQLPPSVPNLLLVAVRGDRAGELDIPTAVGAIRERADHRDAAFFVTRGSPGTRAFYERFLRLGAVMAWCEAAEGDERVAVWVNGSARIAMPDRALSSLASCLRESWPTGSQRGA